MGRPRKPRQLKVIHGTFRKDRNPGSEPEAKRLDAAPPPPPCLNKWGKAMWKDLTAQLIAMKVVTAVDLIALEACCTQYGLYRELQDAIYHIDEEVELDGKRTIRRRKRSLAEYMAGRNSQTMPEYVQMKGAFALLRQYLSEFGLTPAARNRIDVMTPNDDTEDPMERLLGEGG